MLGVVSRNLLVQELILGITGDQWISIAEVLVLVFTLGVLIHQIRESRKVEKARFQYEVVKDIIKGRAEGYRDSEFMLDNPDIKEMVDAAGDKDAFLEIRGTQDEANIAFRLWKECLLDEDTWKILESQLKHFFENPKASAVWDKIDKTLFYPGFEQHIEKLRKEIKTHQRGKK